MPVTTEFAQGNVAGAPDVTQSAGDCFCDELFITTVNGQELDIKNFNVQLTLYEDVFSNVMTGTIIVADAQGLISKAPLVGGEFLSLQYRTPGFDTSPQNVIRKTFVIYGISDRQFDNDRQQFYTLHFISIEGMQDNVSLLSKAFNGSTDTLVSKLFFDYLQSPRWYKNGNFTTDTSNLVVSGGPHASSVHMVAPYWSPLKTINWLAARSLGKQNKAPNFLFFESNKAFYFSSIEDLIEQQRNSGIIFEQYFYSQANYRDETPGYTYRRPNIDRQYQIVFNQRFPTYIDIIKSQDSGYLAATMYTQDLVLKQYKEWTWDYLSNFNSFKHLEDYTVQGNNITSSPQSLKPPFHSLTPKNSTSYRSLRTKQFRMFNDFDDPQYQNWALQRNTLLQEASNIRLEIDVAGRTDAEVGQLIYYHFPNGTDKPFNTDTPFDPVLSGLYFTTAIRHTFTPGKHAMRYEIVKDSFKQSVG
jgi:hypothetical protein